MGIRTVCFSAVLTLILARAAQAQEAAAPLWKDPGKTADERARDLVAHLSLEEKATLLNHVFNGDVQGIISDKWNQCLHGVVWDRPTTMFPISIALSATWDTALVHEEAGAIS